MTCVALPIPAAPTGAADPADLPARLLAVAPRVRAEPGLLWADARGLDAPALARRLLRVLRRAGVAEPRAGVAATPVAARVAALIGPGPVTVVPPGGDRAFLAPHLLAVLDPPRLLLPVLHATGIGRCGELAALDQAAVEVRYGAEGVALRRLAAGDDRRILFAPVPPPLPHAGLEWTDYALTDPERLLFVLQRLATPVCEALRARGEGAVAFTLRFALERGAPVEHTLHPSRAGADRRAWMRLIRDALERLTLPDGVTGLELRVDRVAPSERVQGDLLDRGFAQAGAAAEALARVLDRGAEIVTPSNSRHPLLRRRTRWVAEPPASAWHAPRLGPAPSAAPEGPHLVLDLLAEPRAVTVDADAGGAPRRYRDGRDDHALVHVAGPYVVSGGRWEGAWAFERWTCLRADGELVQLARDARRDAWLLDGTWR
jgi:protein ImuB